jgi:hypothetical protein
MIARVLLWLLLRSWPWLHYCQRPAVLIVTFHFMADDLAFGHIDYLSLLASSQYFVRFYLELNFQVNLKTLVV